MKKAELIEILSSKGIAPPPLPSDEDLPPDADVEQYVAKVYLHCLNVELALKLQKHRRVFRVSLKEDGKFRGSLKVPVEMGEVSVAEEEEV